MSQDASSRMSAARRGEGPVRTIFIRGVAPRSGTNYLRDLVLLHPQVGRGRTPVWEDFVLNDAHLLARYADRVTGRWPDAWGVDRAALQAELLEALGSAARDVLVGRDEPTVVAKTPFTTGIDHFPELFPADVLVLLVRDGRSVVESLRRSFDWGFERSLQEWVRSASRIQRFMRQHASSEGRTWILVRYEEALSDPIGVLDRIAVLAGLEVGTVDEASAHALPVRGSSDTGSSPDGLHWQPVRRDQDFAPERRWNAWDASSLRRFNWVAGERMQELGYELEGPSPGLLDAPGQQALDLASLGRSGARSLRSRLASRRRARTPARDRGVV